MNISLHERCDAFIRLGKTIRRFVDCYPEFAKSNPTDAHDKLFFEAVKRTSEANQWFTIDHVLYSLSSIANKLEEEKILSWVKQYPKEITKPQRVGVVMAGNIPIVGFDDFACVLISGHQFVGKLSSQDKYLLPTLANILIEINPSFASSIEFTDAYLKNIDAVIATGSDNTSLYFEHYFNKYPHIIRGHKNSVAVITGKESEEELAALADDVFLYFGLGCRNVSKLFVPEKYDFNRLFKAFNKYKDYINHNKYAHNYDYRRSIFLVNQIEFIDNGLVLLKQDKEIASPIAVLHYEIYMNKEQVKDSLKADMAHIQCVVSIDDSVGNTRFGAAQQPSLNDYADGIDTMEFLLNL